MIQSTDIRSREQEYDKAETTLAAEDLLRAVSGQSFANERRGHGTALRGRTPPLSCPQPRPYQNRTK